MRQALKLRPQHLIGVAIGAAALAAGIALTYACLFVLLLHGLFHLFWQRAFVDELTGPGNRRFRGERPKTLRGASAWL